MVELLTVLITAALGNSSSFAMSADSKPPQLHLEWSGAESCRPTKDVIDGLFRLLGTDPEQLLKEDLFVSADIQPTARGWSLMLSIPGSQGAVRRRLDAASCAEIAQAAALILSLWVQPARQSEPVLQTRTTRVALEDVPERPPSSVETAPSTRILRAPPKGSLSLVPGAVQPRRARSLVLRAFVGPSLFSGALPSLGWGWEAGLGVDLDRWDFSCVVLRLAEQQLQTNEPAEVVGRFGIWATRARVAHRYRIAPRLELRPGIWAVVGRLHAEALGSSLLEASTPSDGDWGAAGLGASLFTRFRYFTANLELGGGLPLGRPTFWVGQHRLYQTSGFVGFCVLGIGLAFP